jgi:hypothetical protein
MALILIKLSHQGHQMAQASCRTDCNTGRDSSTVRGGTPATGIALTSCAIWRRRCFSTRSYTRPMRVTATDAPPQKLRVARFTVFTSELRYCHQSHPSVAYPRTGRAGGIDRRSPSRACGRKSFKQRRHRAPPHRLNNDPMLAPTAVGLRLPQVGLQFLNLLIPFQTSGSK